MARKRIIDPEFWNDEEIGGWPFQARLFYIALWNFSDDQGRFRAHNSLLKSQIFPYDKKIDMDKLKKLVSSKVRWYIVNGSQYGFITNFLKHQRIDKPTLSKLPEPGMLEEDSANPPGALPPNTTKEKLIEEKRIEPFDFPLLWNLYPRSGRLGEKEARRHFEASVKTKEDFEDIQMALSKFLNSDVVKGDPKYIPHGSKWFNNWKDWIDYYVPQTEFCKQQEEDKLRQELGIK